MDWIYLTIAGILEVVWASSLKYTDGFTKPLPSLLTLSAMTTSFILLAQALKTIPVGTGYVVWTGIGVIGTAIVGAVFLGESRDLSKFICISLIIIGIVGLRFTGSKWVYSYSTLRWNQINIFCKSHAKRGFYKKYCGSFVHDLLYRWLNLVQCWLYKPKKSFLAK